MCLSTIACWSSNPTQTDGTIDCVIYDRGERDWTLFNRAFGSHDIT